MKTTAAIINWNSGAQLECCVDSLLATSADVQILIVDNHSTDGSVDFVAGKRDHVQLIGNKTNRGFAGGVNDAFSHSSSTPYVLILNPDVQALPGSVRLLEDLMDSHPRAGAIGGYVGAKYLPRNFPTTLSLVLENLGLGRRPAFPHPASARAIRVDQVAAAALMIRREAYEQVQHFDEDFYPAWYEDVDFCWKLRRAGWEVQFAPAAEFLHEGGYSAVALGSKAFPYAYYCNQARYAKKWFGTIGSLAVRASIAAGMIGRMIGRPGSAAGYGRVLIGALIGW